MGRSEHQGEKVADAAMANPTDVADEPEAVEEQPEAAKRSSAEENAGEESPREGG